LQIRPASQCDDRLLHLGWSGVWAEEAIGLVESKRPQADLNDALRKRIKTFEQAWLEQNGRNSSE